MPGRNRKDSFPGKIVQEVGIQRPPMQTQAGFAQEVSFEQIPQMDGDVLFYFTHASNSGGESASDLAESWLNHPLWQQLEAVKNNKVYSVSDAVWTTAGGIQAAHLLLDDLEKFLGL